MPVTMKPVKSSNLKSVGYDAKLQELHVEFQGGKTYVYEGVPPHIHEALATAQSPGQYMGHVKSLGYKFRKLVSGPIGG